MKRITFALLAWSALAVVPQDGFAQRERGRGMADLGVSSLGLASQKSVQDELKLSEDQMEKVSELSDKQRESMRGLRDLSPDERRAKFQEAAKANESAIAEILSKEQLGRLKEITLQQQGPAAFASPDVAESLKLSGEQKEKIKTITSDANKARREISESGDREQARTKMQELRKSTNKQYLAVLTDEQKSTWKSMTGEPFKGELRRGGRPGGEGRPNRPNRPDGKKPPAAEQTSLNGNHSVESDIAETARPPKMPVDQTLFARAEDRDEKDEDDDKDRGKKEEREKKKAKSDKEHRAKKDADGPKDHPRPDRPRPEGREHRAERGERDRDHGPPRGEAHRGPSRPDRPSGPPRITDRRGDSGPQGRHEGFDRPAGPPSRDWRGPERFTRFHSFGGFRGGPPSFADFRRPPGPPPERGGSPRRSDFERRIDELQRQIDELRREMRAR